MNRDRLALDGLLVCSLLFGQKTVLGQQTIGRVTLRDAAVTGSLAVSEGRATLQGGGSIVARDHTAELTLDRGGIVNVCATSSLHVTSGALQGGTELTPLLFALDRGAIEVRAVAGPRDVIITPDLRLSTPTGGPVDLRIRVTSNGDTCVENRGVRAPTIEVVEQFGEGRYLVPAGQHVLFEHGSVREVVDRESSPCGCPPATVVSLADNGVTSSSSEAARAGGAAAPKRDEHPFPVAQSQGLAPSTPNVPQVAAGEVHAQVAATMVYGAGADSTAAPAAAATGNAPAAAPPPRPVPTAGGPAPKPVPTNSASAPMPAAPVQPAAPTQPAPETQPKPAAVKAPPPPAPPGAHDIAHSIGHFFKRLFGKG